jgi:hypothetical protein
VILSIAQGQPIEIYSKLIVSISVLLFLVIFLIVGSGPISVDAYFKKHEDIE